AGAHAVGTGLRMIQSGEADAVVCGGAEAALNALAEASFRAMDAISNTGISRPFDARRDGFVMAEGSGMLVLEDAALAAGRGAAARRQRQAAGGVVELVRVRRPQRRALPARGGGWMSALAEPTAERLGPLERLEALCDPGTLDMIRTGVLSRRLNGRERAGD